MSKSTRWLIAAILCILGVFVFVWLPYFVPGTRGYADVSALVTLILGMIFGFISSASNDT